MNKIFWEWVYGYIWFNISEEKAVRFINICSARNIDIIKIYRKDKKVNIAVTVSDFYSMHDIFIKLHIMPHVFKRRGVPFFISKVLKQKIMLCGIASAYAIMYILSLFIWQISVDGNVTHHASELIKYMQECGIEHGMFKKNVNANELEFKIRKKYEDITWVSARVEGTRLIVDIKESSNPNNKSDNSTPRKTGTNIVAPYDGIITKILVRSGTAKVKVGDEVKKGDVIIEGNYSIIGDDETKIKDVYVVPDGTIELKSVFSYSDKIDISYDKKVYDEENESIGIKIFDKIIDLSFSLGQDDSVDVDVINSYDQVKIGESFYLPIYLYQRKKLNYKFVNVNRSDEECVNVLNENFVWFLKKYRENSIHIVENNVTIEKCMGFFEAKGTYTLLINVE